MQRDPKKKPSEWPLEGLQAEPTENTKYGLQNDPVSNVGPT